MAISRPTATLFLPARSKVAGLGQPSVLQALISARSPETRKREPAMAEVTIRTRPNGPFVVEGPFKLVDSQGNAFTLDSSKPAFALCRCGASANKPFCDGNHKSCGFEADEAAPAPSS